MRIGESLPKSEDSLSSQQAQRRRRHSGSIPDATTALSMMGGNDTRLTAGPDRLAYQVNEKKSNSATANHRHRSLSDSRSTNPRIGARGMLRHSFWSYFGNGFFTKALNVMIILNNAFTQTRRRGKCITACSTPQSLSTGNR